MEDIEVFLQKTDRTLAAAKEELAHIEDLDRQQQAALDAEIRREVEAMDAAAGAYARQLSA